MQREAMVPSRRCRLHVARFATGVGFLLAAMASSSVAQQTGTPVFHSPYRSFVRYEMGGAVSFLEGSHTGIEGHVRRAFGVVDVALRGGALVRDNDADSFLAGLDLRVPLVAEERSPLRGALVFGAGFDIRGDVAFRAPIGLALGRRLLVEKSAVSLVPFVAPTVTFSTIGGDEVEAGVGLGLDLRLSGAFEVRVSGGFGTTGAPEGIAVTAAWLR